MNVTDPLTIAVVGLGKIGLPLAVQYAGKGHRVIGVDVNPRVVELVGSGTEPFPGEADLDVRLKQVVADGRLRAATGGTSALPSTEPRSSPAGRWPPGRRRPARAALRGCGGLPGSGRSCWPAH